MNLPNRDDGPEPSHPAAYRSKIWGVIDNGFPQDEASSDVIADDEQSNEIPTNPSSLEYAQQLFEYCPGGLHSVRLWDSLDSRRYTVIHKLI